MIESEMSRGVWLSRSEAESTTLFEILARYEKEIIPGKKGAVQEYSLIRILKGTQLAKAIWPASGVPTSHDSEMNG